MYGQNIAYIFILLLLQRLCKVKVKIYVFDLFFRMYIQLTSLLWVQCMDDGSGKFRTIHVRLIVEPIFIKISPVRSPSRIPKICVMGSAVHLPHEKKEIRKRINK